MEVIEPIINFQKVPYKILSELIEAEFIKNKTINLYVNVNELLKYFYKPEIVDAMNSLRSKENLILIPEIINLLAHYRHYFFSRYGSSSRFFLYYMNEPVSSKPKYYMSNVLERMSTDKVREGLMNDIIKSNLKIIKNICLYLQNIYYIDSYGIESSLIPYFIIKKLNKKENESHIVITRDYYEYQLLNLDNVKIMTAAGKMSKIYNKENIYDKKFKSIKYKTNNKISPELFTFIMSLTGYKDRNINKIDKYGFGKAIKKLDNFIDNNLIENCYSANMKEKSILFNIDYDELMKNFLLCDLKSNYRTLSDNDKKLISNNLINLRDNNSIMNINQEYFPYNNIKLIELEEGEYRNG